MTTLDVPGAQLYYELHGKGPLLLMVPGGNGTADAFRPFTEQLASDFTVLIYDRRGFSRSLLDGPQDLDHRLETDADDVDRLLKHLTDEPAILFGVSSGGVVVLEFLTRYAPAARTVIPYEPAAVKQLKNGDDWVTFFTETYHEYREAGPELALNSFRKATFAELDGAVMARVMDLGNAQILANAIYWFENELRQYPAADLDLDSLRSNADRIVLMVGTESRSFPCYQVNVELGEKLGLEVVEMPGGHVGFASDPVAFAQQFLDVLSRLGHGPKD